MASGGGETLRKICRPMPIVVQIGQKQRTVCITTYMRFCVHLKRNWNVAR
jgi:hypothetical protein